MKRYILTLLIIASTTAFGSRKLSVSFENWGTKPTPLFYKPYGPEGVTRTQFGGIANLADARARSIYSANFTCSSSTRSQIMFDSIGTMTAPIRGRYWYWFNGGTPTSNIQINALTNNVTDDVEITFRTDGKISLGRLGVVASTSTNAVSGAHWALLKLYTNWSATTDTTFLIIDATVAPETIRSFVSHTGILPTGAQFGCLTTPAAGASASYLMDDIAINDASGSYETGWPEDTASIQYHPPTSDNARVGFTTGSGGTTNLWQNLLAPPAGTNTDGVVITDVQSSATDNYSANCRSLNSYVDVSGNAIPAGNAVRLMYAFVRDGEHATSGTESGAVSFIRNPVEVGEKTFTYGNDQGAHFSDAQSVTNEFWTTHNGNIQYWPNVLQQYNRADSVVVQVGKRTASSNGVCVDNIGYFTETGSHTGEPSMVRQRVIHDR